MLAVDGAKQVAFLINLSGGRSNALVVEVDLPHHNAAHGRDDGLGVGMTQGAEVRQLGSAASLLELFLHLGLQLLVEAALGLA